MNDRVRYKCLKCNREIYIINNGEVPFCCGQKMVEYDKNFEEKIKKNDESNESSKDVKVKAFEKEKEIEKDKYLIDFLKSKF